MTDRAVSIALTHALTVAISTVLVSGLIIGAGTLLESQEQTVGETQLREIGSDAVTYINTLDRLNRTGENVTVTAEPDYPERILGSYRYTIAIENRTGSNTLVVRSEQLGRSVEFDIETRTNVTSSGTSGGDVEISLCEGDRLTLAGCGS
ncbi:hypothetical protein GRX03_08510 [Halovenus sp. WSH3]|uniref:Flagellin n=1 Tax=Halovenus carboxidivorans TaxID=2692199 RepID=A0A6B0T7R4_9EURY|nr:hypothetical protein [Halovenus carboxidivorans]MXR51643.1 hypothetical protein [Halovenus carboxidivorans]